MKSHPCHTAVLLIFIFYYGSLQTAMEAKGRLARRSGERAFAWMTEGPVLRALCIFERQGLCCEAPGRRGGGVGATSAVPAARVTTQVAGFTHEDRTEDSRCDVSRRALTDPDASVPGTPQATFVLPVRPPRGHVCRSPGTHPTPTPRDRRQDWPRPSPTARVRTGLTNNGDGKPEARPRTSVRDEQLAGQGQGRDGVLAHQGRQAPCGAGGSAQPARPPPGPRRRADAWGPCGGASPGAPGSARQRGAGVGADARPRHPGRRLQPADADGARRPSPPRVRGASEPLTG